MMRRSFASRFAANVATSASRSREQRRERGRAAEKIDLPFFSNGLLDANA